MSANDMNPENTGSKNMGSKNTGSKNTDSKNKGSEHRSTEQDDKVLAVGKERINLRTATNKLHADIAFLRDHIEKMKRFSNPNEATLGVYEEMLRSRESVLAWLEEQKKSDPGLANETGSKKQRQTA